MNLSPRLLACAQLVAPGDRVADIGCDHGYLGIHLLKNGIAKSVIAADIRKGPLAAAIGNGEKYGVGDRMSFHLSDGVQSIPRDFDTLVCAGMGGDTMVSILDAAPWLKNTQYRLILQCQSKTPMLRQYLLENGWRIKKEILVRDGRFLYTVMEIRYDGEEREVAPGEWYFPPALLENEASVLKEYYRWVIGGLEIVTAHQQEEEKLQGLYYLQNHPSLAFLKEETL